MITTDVTVTLIGITCCKCGCVFGVNKRTKEQLRENHEMFYCPSGHGQYFPQESNLERAERLLREERERSEAKLKSVQHSLQWESDRRLDAEKGLLAERRVKTRYKNERDRIKARVANGVCPCCNRTFKNLASHMAGKHPDYTKQEEK